MGAKEGMAAAALLVREDRFPLIKIQPVLAAFLMGGSAS